jgi:hypothetical protein
MGIMITAATSLTISGFQGVLFIAAVLVFLAATIIAFFVTPRNYWAVLVSAGLLFWVLTQIIHS